MIQRRFDEITKADIEALVENGVREIRTLDYKAELPGGSDEEKREFLYDVSSFANASGGDLLFGVPSEEGVPIRPLGLGGSDYDAAILRMENILRDGIAPRIPGIRMNAFDGFTNGSVIIVRVPKSWASPHMVTFKNVTRFYSRNSAGKYPLDVTEIRAAFASSEALPERIRRFRDDRLAKIIAGETPVRLQDNAKIVMHVVPVRAMSMDFQLDPEAIRAQSSLLQPIDSGGTDGRYNFDGFLVTSGFNSKDRAFRCYCQAFRSGTIESVNANLLGWNDTKIMGPLPIETQLCRSLRAYVDALARLEVPEPAVVMVTLIGVVGFELKTRQSFLRDPTPIDRDLLVLPEVSIEDYKACDAAFVLRPVFDAVWNAAGYECSYNYDDDGVWKPQH